MNKIIKITPTDINGSEINSVNARELYAHLDLAQGQFQRWINKNLVKNDFFTEDKDYIGVRLIVEGNDVADYVITLDVAKHLSMMAKTKVAHKLRDYFINVEKKSKAIALPKNALKEIKLALAGVVELDERLDTQHNRLNDVESYIQREIELKPVDHTQQSLLLGARHTKVFDLLKMYEVDKSDREFVRKLYARIGSMFKKEFSIPRYNALPASKFNDGIAFLNGVKLKDI